MEIKTNRSQKGSEDPESPPSRDKSMYLRRRTSQQVRRSYTGNRLLVRAANALGKLVVLVLVVTFLGSIVFYSLTSDKFALRSVTLVGCKHLNAASLEAVVRNEFPSHLLRIDLGQLRERLEQETWVRTVEIRRILPSDLVIYVQERTPSVVLEIHGELALADEIGVLLDRYDSKYGKLDVPVFRGLLGDTLETYRTYRVENTERVKLGLRMLAELDSGSPAFTRSISEVDLSDKTNVKLQLVDDTAEIQIGDRDFLKRFRTLMSNMDTYREVKAEHSEIASVDLRFDGQIIYRPRKSAAEQTATAEARKR